MPPTENYMDVNIEHSRYIILLESVCFACTRCACSWWKYNNHALAAEERREIGLEGSFVYDVNDDGRSLNYTTYH